MKLHTLRFILAFKITIITANARGRKANSPPIIKLNIPN